MEKILKILEVILFYEKNFLKKSKILYIVKKIMEKMMKKMYTLYENKF